MVHLPDRAQDGELYSYVQNFERGLIIRCRDEKPLRQGKNLEEVYDSFLEEWGGRWENNGYLFEDDRDATAFLLRWA